MSFREAFTKSKEQLLDYDDNASLYFGATGSLLILLPVTYYLLSTVHSSFTGRHVLPFRHDPRYHYCRCSLCQRVVDRKLKQARAFCTSIAFLCQLLCWVLLVVLCSKLVLALSTVSEIQAFNPFHILNIGEGVPEKAIKKAYRTLSLRHHPDKNPNDPTAAAKFTLISKAYQALTDETARTNYEKYGNPDGPGSMKIGIGLPHFLIDENNQKSILLLFVVILIFSIPFLFLSYYHRIKLYNSCGVRVDTVHFFSFYLKEKTIRFQQIAEFLAASAESQEQNFSTDDLPELEASLVPKIRSLRTPRFTLPLIRRNYILILAHLQRLHDHIPARLRRDLDALLIASPRITQSMIEIASVQGWLYVVKNIVILRRSIIQALAPDLATSSLYQIPHCTPELVKQCEKSVPPLKTLRQFIDTDDDVKAKILAANLTKNQEMDVKEFCSHVPRAKLDMKAEVVGESEIVAGDVVTVTITLTRLDLKHEGAMIGPVHAPMFPDLKMEEWWVLLVNKRNADSLVAYARLRGHERKVKAELKFSISTPGSVTFQLIAMSDSYEGLDVTQDIEVKVLRPQDVKREILVHPDDEALEFQPSLFQYWQQEEDHDHETTSDDE